MRTLIHALSVAACLAAPARAETEYWSGRAEREGTVLTINMLLDRTVQPVRGSIDLPDFQIVGITLLEFEVSGTNARLGFGESAVLWYLEGSMDDDQFSGQFRNPARDRSTPFTLARIEDPRPYTTEDVAYEGAGVTLGGTIFVPKTPGPHPGIVLIHGSGDDVRRHGFTQADFFARQGLVALAFDKRGCGASTGNWRLVGFEPLAQDGLAGIRLLQARADVDPNNVGFWGISQAGWIMPLAASLAPDDVAFIITTSGATVNVEDEGKYDYMVRLRDAGYSGEAIEKAERILDLDHDVTVTGEGYDELRELVKAAHDEPWWETFDFQLTPAGARRFPKLIAQFDPRPILEQINTPILWMYGDEDKSVESPRSIAILNEIMAAKPKPWTIKTFPGADHGLHVPPPPNAAFPLRPYAPGHWDTIADWLEKHVLPGT